jgi:hypothetical protein
MNFIFLVVVGIICLSYFIPYTFIRIKKFSFSNKILLESKKYKQLQNFIEIKKYEFEKFDKITIFLMTLSITLFLAAKLSNITSILAYFILTIGFISSLSTFININKVHQKIIRKLYYLKDKFQR